MYKEILLAVTISIDTYIAAAANCSGGIRIPLLSSVIINLVCSAVLGISLYLSGLLGQCISPDLFRICGRCIIISIGLLTILKSFARPLARRVAEKGELSLKLGKTPLALKLYLDDTAADMDSSKVLSAGEAAALALASSLDSAAMGMGSGFSDISPFIASAAAFVCGCAAVQTGILTGKKLSSLNHDLSWVGGLMLIIFAFVN